MVPQFGQISEILKKWKWVIFKAIVSLEKIIQEWNNLTQSRTTFQILSWMRGGSFWPLKIAITRSIFEIQGLSFGFSPLFACSKNHVWQPILEIFNFLVPPPRRVCGNNLWFKFFENFHFWYLGKVKKFKINTYKRFGAIVISARGGFGSPPPLRGRVQKRESLR